MNLKALVVATAAAAWLATGAVGVRTAAAAPEYQITAADLRPLGVPMRRQIASLQYLMNPYQLRQFFSLPSDSARDVWIRRFWLAHDPTPTTPRNEMKTEHYIRADIASMQFPISRFPGWDKRGEILIRYGFPDYRGKIESEVTVSKVHAPGELWFYRRHQMLVRFSDESLKGDYQFAITPLGDAEDASPELAEFLIYDTQETIQEQIPQQYLQFYQEPAVNDTGVKWGLREQLLGMLEPKRYLRPRLGRTSEHIDEIVDPDYARSLPENPSTVFQADHMRKLASNFQAVLEDTPSSYPFNFARKSFRFYFDVDRFRGGEGVNRVEVNFEFPLEALPHDNPPARSYRADVVVMDANYDVVQREKHDIAVPSRDIVPGRTRLVPAQIVVTLPSRYYRLGVSMEDLDASRTSAYRTNVRTANFDKDLAISDVLFAQKISPASSASPFTRGAIDVVPHPIRRYAVGSPVPVYFEVYNLGTHKDGTSDYEVEYRVTPHSDHKQGLLDRFRGGQTVFSSRFKSSGYGATEPLHLTIQTTNLKPGLYDFMVRVKDNYWQSQQYREASFRIVEPSKKDE